MSQVPAPDPRPVAQSFWHTHGGGVHPTAIVGNAPEHRDWKPGDYCLMPSVDPSARVEAFCTIDAGMRRSTRVGARSWLLKRVHVGHDARVGEDCTLAVGVIVGGHVKIGDRVRVGLGAVILPFREIGDDAVIGAGAVVTKNVPAGVTVVGNPARVLEDHERDPRPFDRRVDPISGGRLLEGLHADCMRAEFTRTIEAVSEQCFIPEAGWVSRKTARRLLDGRPPRWWRWFWQ